MSVSLNSTKDSTTAEVIKELAEEVADLSQNHDEIVDLEVGLAALGGLRHSAACSASERSSRRYDERNHRFHESRMKALGMEGEEKEPEAEDMSQQVLIRSPTIHNHYGDKPTQPAPTTPQQPIVQPTQPAPVQPPPSIIKTGLGSLGTAALLATGIGGGALATYLLTRPAEPVPVVSPDRPDKNWGLNLLPPDPKKAP